MRAASGPETLVLEGEPGIGKSTLELGEIEENKCPDHVAETILTSRPWTKTS